MNTKQLRKFVTAALMAAMTCVATFTIHIPSPAGYIHPGDAFVLLSGIILGPIYGPLAAGIGSMISDLLLGFPQYALPTFIIKALVALVAALIYKKGKLVSVVLAGILGGVIVTSGYFCTDNFIYGFAAAVEQLPLNGIQNGLGIVVSTLLYPLLQKVPQIKELMDGR